MKAGPKIATPLIVPDEAVVIADLLGVLQHPLRLMMVCELLEGELCAGQITEKFGTTKGNISQHLSLLLRQGILERDTRATKNFYRIADPRVKTLLRVLKETFCPNGPSGAVAAPSSSKRATRTTKPKAIEE